MATTRPADPCKTFRFRVFFSGSTQPVIGVSKVTGFTRTTEVIKHRDGGDPATSAKLPGRTEYAPITLERGVTVNVTEFVAWANKVWDYQNAQGGTETSLADFRRDLVINVYDETGQPVLSYQVFNCWVSEYQPISDLDANANAVAIEHIKIENEGWVQDNGLPAPKPVTFNDPAT
jgi:phage tail-like protein